MAIKGVIPTFFLNEQIINTESDICAYLLKFLFWNPGSTSNQIEQTLLSMRKLSATHAENINTFPIQLADMMTEALNNYHQGWRCTVEVINRDDENLTYGILIKIIDAAGADILTTDSLMIKDGMLTIRNEMDEMGYYANASSPRRPKSSYHDINLENARAEAAKREAAQAAAKLKEIKDKEYQEATSEKVTVTAKQIKEQHDTRNYIDEFTTAITEATKRNDLLQQLNKEKPNYVG